jgi:FlaG/FlaF family flagellin (archaellin)
MSVTPLVPGYRLVIEYFSDLTHRAQLLVDAHSTGGSYVLDEFGGTTTPVATFAALYAATMKPVFHTTASFTTWILEQYSGGAYIQVDTGSLGVAGTNSTATAIGSQWTFKLIDTDNKQFALRILGLVEGDAFKFGYGQLSGPALTLVNELIDTTSGHMGAVLRGRSGTVQRRFVALTSSLNRKSRRRLGIV